MGITVFLLAFAIEEPAGASRWNISTFLDSMKHAVLIYIVPFAFFSLINARFLFLDFRSKVDALRQEGKQELMVHIDSSLKKESLDFRADELVYTMADGNYVMFHLFRDNSIKKIPIRNSIADIEDQLKLIPMFYRCHRGFIINLLHVESKKGNASGYTLKLKHVSERIPVARNRIRDFDRLFSNSLS
jgi:DNA-binding LytR/AlgR family response regulator